MIGRAITSLVALTVGVIVGAALVLATTGAPAAPRPTGTTDDAAPGTAPTVPSPVGSAGTAGDATADGLPDTTGSLLLVWTAGGLPDGFADDVAGLDGVADLTEVRAGRLDLTEARDASGTILDRPEPGWAIPLDTTAIDPTGFRAFVPTGERRVIDRLAPGSVILSETSARLRGAEVGARLALGAEDPHTVVGIVGDAAVGAAEAVLHVDDGLAATMSPRYVLLRHDRGRTAVERDIRDAAGAVGLRVRAPGETPYLRHGDAVLPQAVLKERYGEFTYRPPDPGDRSIEIDPAWVDDHIETRRVPLLGTVTCHRAALDVLDEVMVELQRRGLAHTVDPEGFAGCFNPRLIGARGDLSRHAWGVAVDVNAAGNPTGTGSGQPEVVVELLTRAGFGWGGTWLVPDPMHFELVSDPRAAIKASP